MADEAPRWIDSTQFQWTPETPLRFEPEAPAFAPQPAPDNFVPPEAAQPTPAEASFQPEGFTRIAEPRTSFGHKPLAPTNSDATSGHYGARLLTGLIQGLGLMALLGGRAILDPMVFAAASMVLLFAPCVLLAGLEHVPRKGLVAWTLFAAAGLAALGFYHAWRASGDGFGFMLPVMAAALLFIAQSMLNAAAQSDTALAPYPAYRDAAWALAAQMILCAVFMALAWVAATIAVGYLRTRYPAAPDVPAMPLALALAAALASGVMTSSHARPVRQIGQIVLTALLPFLVLAAAAMAVAGVLRIWPPPLALLLAMGFGLLLAINGSYGIGGPRARWREQAEFIGAFLLAALAALGALALAARVIGLGWTAPRVFCAAGLLVLGGYAALYCASALASLGGGLWMQRIERANLVMAFVMLSLLAALASPLADPARLTVASQTWRLEHGLTPPTAFDFDALRRNGARFGDEALHRMAAGKLLPDLARGAFIALTQAHDPEPPTPTQVGANIHVRTPGARLPAALLARDWTGVAGAPPCLTAAALPCDAYFTDLDGDGANEVVLVYGNGAGWWAGVMKQGIGGGWYPAGTLASPACAGSFEALRAGHYAPVAPLNPWRDLLVAGARLKVTPINGKPAPCP